VENTLAYYDTTTITVAKTFSVQAVGHKQTFGLVSKLCLLFGGWHVSAVR